MNKLPDYNALEVCTHNRLLAINQQIRAQRKSNTSTTLLVMYRKQTDKLLSKIRVARQKDSEDFSVYNSLLTEYKQQTLV